MSTNTSPSEARVTTLFLAAVVVASVGIGLAAGFLFNLSGVSLTGG